MHRPFIAVLASLLAFAAAQPLSAGRVVRVYAAGVTSQDSPAALQDAMRQVLVRATGRRDAGSDPALAAIVADAARYVQLYRAAPGGGTEVVFDSSAVEDAIASAGRNAWEANRPFTLIVLQPALTGAAADDARRDIERVAAERGLPVSVVPLALADGAGIELERSAILQNAQRFGGDAVLIGRHEGAGSSWQWTLHGPVGTSSWSGAIESGVHGAVDALARTEETSFALAEAEARIAIDGVISLTDYAAIDRLLESIPGVRNVTLEEANGASVTFRVLARGGADGLEQQLAGSQRLTRKGASGGRLQYEYQR
jgi:uncharacterized protein